MAEQGSAKSIKAGFTLIEVMVALVIFSVLVGMASQFVASGVKYPFVADRVEPWLGFMEESSQALKKLPHHSALLSSGTHTDPFPGIKKPAVLSFWKLEWKSSNLAGYQVACFSAQTQHNKLIEWHVYYKTP
jgi:prepilin-type N-terminal cleavage/methylation domain-containing protein